ncbi:MAG: (4Fe-4S)-binding protein [Bacteroidota bacterium]
MQIDKNTFTNGEITVTYEPKKCIHAEKCRKGLEEVFRSSVLPWIDLDGAQSEKIIAQIGQCPSGALSFERKKELADAS